MNELRQQLDDVIRQGSTIVIRYNGGSRPGEERAVIPLLLSNEELVAREIGQRQGKHFKLAKIASFRLLDGEAVVNPAAISVTISFPPEYETFEEFVPGFEQLAMERRWHIVKDKDYFAVCEFFKNGKPKSTPCISIQFFDRSTETVLDFETGELVEKQRELTGRERPWRVDSKRMGDGKSFSLLPRAAELFMEELRLANQSRQ